MINMKTLRVIYFAVTRFILQYDITQWWRQGWARVGPSPSQKYSATSMDLS